MLEDHNEPNPDTSTKPIDQEEIVDPTSKLGNTDQVIIRRHPFGIVAIILQVVLGIVLAFGLVLFILPQLLSPEAVDSAINLVISVGLIVAVIAGVFLIVAAYIYSKNKWIVTDDSISQVLQMGLFRRQISELSMANVEDVTSEQQGIIATIFGFGLLKVETAGEHSNFHFNYCPTPDKYAQIILHAREHFIEGSPEVAKRANEKLAVPIS